MRVTFYKYQGAGNDFVMLDNRFMCFLKDDSSLVAKLCDRRFGVGADGLILIEKSAEADFSMVYYNADGNESTMCGNGGRCAVAFAKELGIVDRVCEFIAVDGIHYAELFDRNLVRLKMRDVAKVNRVGQGYFVDTGSPHHIEFVDNVEDWDVYVEGRKLRWDDRYQPGGTNVNFVSMGKDNTWHMRTFERGVENETLSCGTGAVAVAIVLHRRGMLMENEVELKVSGGKLRVNFIPKAEAYTEIFLNGEAQQVYKGEINL